MSCRNHSSDLQCKSNDWFLYELQHWAEMSESVEGMYTFKIYCKYKKPSKQSDTHVISCLPAITCPKLITEQGVKYVQR